MDDGGLGEKIADGSKRELFKYGSRQVFFFHFAIKLISMQPSLFRNSCSLSLSLSVAVRNHFFERFSMINN